MAKLVIIAVQPIISANGTTLNVGKSEEIDLEGVVDVTIDAHKMPVVSSNIITVWGSNITSGIIVNSGTHWGRYYAGIPCIQCGNIVAIEKTFTQNETISTEVLCQKCSSVFSQIRRLLKPNGKPRKLQNYNYCKADSKLWQKKEKQWDTHFPWQKKGRKRR